MSDLKSYYLYAGYHAADGLRVIEDADDEHGNYYRKKDADARLATDKQTRDFAVQRSVELATKVVELEAFIAAKDRDLADANHMLLLANNSRDACMRVAQQRQPEIVLLRARLALMYSAVEWCLENGAHRAEYSGVPVIEGMGFDLQIPAEFAGIIKPTTGASNG